MTKTTKTAATKSIKGATGNTAAAATVVKVTAAALYAELVQQISDNGAVRSIVADVLGPDAVGPWTNVSWYRWDVKRQAKAAARRARS